MLSCLRILGKAAAAFRAGDEHEGQRILDAVHHCTESETCGARHICSTAALGISRTRSAGHGTPAAV